MTGSMPISRADSYPIGGWTRFQNTVPHFEYALTWWGLAAALVATAVARFVLRRSREDADAPEPAPAVDVR
jgi:cytochrome oxidase assembly protein ShyY1